MNWLQRLLQRGIFRMRRTDRVDPRLHIAAGRAIERAGEVRQFATQLPPTIDHGGRRTAGCDVAAERKKRRRETRIELGDLLQTIRRVLF